MKKRKIKNKIIKNNINLGENIQKIRKKDKKRQKSIE
jgi:hypothetical protein